MRYEIYKLGTKREKKIGHKNMQTTFNVGACKEKQSLVFFSNKTSQIFFLLCFSLYVRGHYYKIIFVLIRSHKTGHMKCLMTTCFVIDILKCSKLLVPLEISFQNSALTNIFFTELEKFVNEKP